MLRKRWCAVLGSTAAMVLLCFGSPRLSAAQAPSAAPLLHFDIYTVKPSRLNSNGMSMSWHDNVFSATHVTLKFMLQVAYNIRQPLIENVPKWGESDYWDVQGKISDYDPAVRNSLSMDQKRAMQQEFLARAFGVVAHTEQREQAVYDLVIAKSGVKIPRNTIDPNSPEAAGRVGSMSMSGERLDAQGVPLDNLCKALEGVVDRTILDKTGLTGRYDFALRWRPDALDGRQDDNGEPDIFTAVQEQLGLKLVPSRSLGPVLVVDAAKLPETD